jgi:cellulose synthase/poly-beta-1,6-N-acetylglucosamine synthase-like glycosyltransferase
MELVIVMFIIWLIMSIIVIGSASILTLLNKGRARYSDPRNMDNYYLYLIYD